jgi:hypothetical protein
MKKELQLTWHLVDADPAQAGNRKILVMTWSVRAGEESRPTPATRGEAHAPHRPANHTAGGIVVPFKRGSARRRSGAAGKAARLVALTIACLSAPVSSASAASPPEAVTQTVTGTETTPPANQPAAPARMNTRRPAIHLRFAGFSRSTPTRHTTGATRA